MKHVTFGRDTLRGLEAVAVVVEQIAVPAAAQAGITVEKLQSQIENRLYEAGVGVVSLDGLSNQDRRPVLYVRPSLVQVVPQGYCYGLSLYLMQEVTLLGGEQTEALTWEHGIIGTVVKNRWQTLMSNLQRGIDAFIEDYTSVNHGQERPADQGVH